MTNISDTPYVIGSVVGPYPYPTIVREFQSVVGKEARKQIQKTAGRLPDVLVACVGGGSNAMGLFAPFAKDQVRFIGVEAAGNGIESGKHSAPLCAGRVGILHGAKSYLLQNDEGQISEAHSVAGVCRHASEFKEEDIILINLSSRGDKDLDIVARYLKEEKS